MAPLAARAPPLTLRRAVRTVGRADRVCVVADVARRGQRKAAGAPARHVPQRASQLRAEAAPSYRQRTGCAALLHVRWPTGPARLRRAFKDVEEVLTAMGTWAHGHGGLPLPS